MEGLFVGVGITFKGWIHLHPWVSLILFLILFRVLLPHILFWFRKAALHFRSGDSDGHFFIRNECRTIVYVRMFVSKGLRPWQQSGIGGVVEVLPGREVAIPLPKGVAWDSEVVVGFHHTKVALEEMMMKKNSSGQPRYYWRALGVGVQPRGRMLFFLVHPHFARKPGAIQLLSSWEHSLLDKVATSLHHLSESKLGDGKNDTECIVCDESSLVPFRGKCAEEDACLELRKKLVQKALKDLLGLDKYCNVVVLSSGGGARAMIAGAGAVDGLIREGILGATSFLGTTSGSCWFLAQFMEQCRGGNASLEECIEKTRLAMRSSSEKPLFSNLTELAQRVAQNIALKVRYRQSVTLVDVFGAVLGSRYSVPPTLSSQKEAPLLKSGQMPMPLYHLAALDVVERHVISEQFTPFSVSFKGCKIPSQALGRPFDAKECIDTSVPEVSMSFLLGASGSAFCSTVEKIAENVFWVGSRSAAKAREWVLQSGVQLVDYTWTQVRKGVQAVGIDNRNVAMSVPLVYPGHVHSWLFDSKAPEYIPSSIAFIDGGIHTNMAWDLARRNNAQVVIAFDHSDDVGPDGYLTLKGLQHLQQRGDTTEDGLVWPAVTVDTAVLDSKKIHTFGDPSKGEIIIVYIPTKPFNDETDFNPRLEMGPLGFCSTANFVYTPEQFDKLYNLVRDNVGHYRETILSAIKRAAISK